MTLQEIVQAKETELRPLRSEVGIAFSSTGRILLKKQADPDDEYSLEFTDEEIQFLKRTGKVIFTHNHPRGWTYPPDDPRHAGNSFSQEDILLACRVELAEIRAVTPLYVYSMKPPVESLWTEATWRQEIQPLYEAVRLSVKNRLYVAALRSELSPAEASAQLDHEVWIEVARMLGLRYSRFEE